MKIRPKVPVCTDCDHVFEYKGQNPGQLGGVVEFYFNINDQLKTNRYEIKNEYMV